MRFRIDIARDVSRAIRDIVQCLQMQFMCACVWLMLAKC